VTEKFRSAALEAAPKQIRVNAIPPGAVDTPMLWNNPDVKSGVEHINKAEVGKPEDLAAAIAFLASDDARFI
jgi:NAD(P)-dependent dehydrogenase (short-subunit alcohol dehydrogenase family)